MADKLPIDVKILEINGFPIHVEQYDSSIIVKDENGNSMEISKMKDQSIVLSLYGIFTTGKKNQPTTNNPR